MNANIYNKKNFETQSLCARGSDIPKIVGTASLTLGIPALLLLLSSPPSSNPIDHARYMKIGMSLKRVVVQKKSV
jgi:hypothetical protein